MFCFEIKSERMNLFTARRIASSDSDVALCLP